MAARSLHGLVLPVLMLGLANSLGALQGHTAERDMSAWNGRFQVAQADTRPRLSAEERAQRRAEREQRRQERAARQAERAAEPAGQRNPNREGVRRRPPPAEAGPPARSAERPAPPPDAQRPARPDRPARPARPARPQAAPPVREAYPAPERKRRGPFRKLERNVRKFLKKEFRRDRRLDEFRAVERAAEARRAEGARRDDLRRRSFEGRPFVPRDFDRREFQRREARREFREFRREEFRRGRVYDDRAARRYARSRRHLIRSQRYRNRFNGGYSVYYLPPAGIALAAGLYALDSSRASYEDYFDAFMAPPVRRLGRRYSMDEIVTDPELWASVRSVNIDVITFYSGSARIAESQLDRLEDLADAIHATLRRRPNEVFLIAGHTDAVGPFDENLDLSESRAVAVLDLLVTEFGVPERNLEAVGYGEQYLRVNTDGPDRRNRRVVVRAIGSLLSYR